MRTSLRWALAGLIVVIALVVALSREMLRDPFDPTGPGGPTAAEVTQDRRDVDTAAALAGPRARAALPPCPTPADGRPPAVLAGVELECAGDGRRVDLAAALAGRTVVLNLWAYWCGPCADELPAMAEYQRRMGAKVTVLTVHQAVNEEAGLLRMADLGVRLPTLQDGQRRVAQRLAVPNVMPATVVVRADGTVAGTLPRAFTSADEIAAAVNPLIGEPVEPAR